MHLRYLFSIKLTLALTLFLGVLLVCPFLSFAAGDTAVVAANAVNIRGGPGTNYDVISQVGLGERLAVLEQSGDWCNVLLASGGNGWIAGWLVDVEQPQAPDAPETGGQVAVVNGSYVNIRSGPGTGYNIIGQVGSGDRLPFLEQSGDWCKVSLDTGVAGWIAGWLVNLEAAGSPLPPPVNPPAPSDSGASQDFGKVAVISGSVVNVRSGPGTSNGVIGQVVQGDKLSILEQSGDWYRVRMPDGGDGWVAGWLASVQDASPAQPQPPDEQNQPPTQPQPPEQSGNDDVSRGGGRNTDTQSGKVISLKVSNVGSKTSTVIKADTPFDYSSFFLSNPDRLVMDLKGVAIGDLPQNTEVDSKTVRKVRAGYYQKNPDVTRLVFELSGGAQYMASLSGDQKTLTVQTYIPDINGSYAGKVIFIDPGHGGPDPGAVGSKGTKEKQITLDVAKRVAKLLEARGAKVAMSRTGDQDVGLYEITDKANYAKADIFVSIHINANTDPTIGGTSTYIWRNNGDSAQTARVQESARLARYVQAELVKNLGLRDIGVKEANFAVLRTSNMPAILAELAFISNLSEEEYINTDVFKNGAAEAIVKGIGRYFSERRTA